MGPDKISKGVQLVPEKVTGKVPATGGWDAGYGMLDVESPTSTIKSVQAAGGSTGSSFFGGAMATAPASTHLGGTDLGGGAIGDWSIRRVEAIRAPVEYSTTSDATYGRFWGKDGGVEATTRLKGTGKFDAWYSNGMHITRPDTGLPLVIQTATGKKLFETTDKSTMEPKKLAYEPADEEKKHLFGIDHWFMGAKYPNQDTMSMAVRDTYYAK